MQLAKRNRREVRVGLCNVLYRGQSEEMTYGTAEEFMGEVKVARAESKEMEAGWRILEAGLSGVCYWDG